MQNKIKIDAMRRSAYDRFHRDGANPQQLARKKGDWTCGNKNICRSARYLMELATNIALLAEEMTQLLDQENDTDKVDLFQLMKKALLNLQYA